LDYLVEATVKGRVALSDKAANEMREMFLVLDKTLDELFNENTELTRRVLLAKKALSE
jgi:hypothetical protein